MLWALAGPMPGKSDSSSGVAVFRFTAPSTALPAARAAPPHTDTASRTPTSNRTPGSRAPPPRRCLLRCAGDGDVGRAEAGHRLRIGREQHAPQQARLATIVAAPAVGVARASLGALALLVRLFGAHIRGVLGHGVPLLDAELVGQAARGAVSRAHAAGVAHLREELRRERADTRRAARARALVTAGDRAIAVGLGQIARARAVRIAVDARLALVADLVAARAAQDGRQQHGQHDDDEPGPFHGLLHTLIRRRVPAREAPPATARFLYQGLSKVAP